MKWLKNLLQIKDEENAEIYREMGQVIEPSSYNEKNTIER